MTVAVTALELRVIEDVLRMETGYVLDFTDRSFALFFEDFGIDIGDDLYCGSGFSKAKRLRSFLRVAEVGVVAKVLEGLLQHRLAEGPDSLSTPRRTEYEKVIQRLRAPAVSKADGPPESELPKIAFDSVPFERLPIDAELREAVVARVMEAQKCLRAGAYLSAVILCGSVLEGVCMGFGARQPDRFRAGFTERFGKPAPQRLGDWNLFEWLAVMRLLDEVSPTVEKYGHALRDFRNYVHPAQQLRAGYVPDEHNARIALQVVLAAAADLSRKSQSGEG